MAKDRVYNSNDAAGIKPRLIPDYELLTRDDSGGPDYQPYNAEFGDGGYVTGEKAHLSAHGGENDSDDGDEIVSTFKERDKNVSPKAPSSSRKYSKE